MANFFFENKPSILILKLLVFLAVVSGRSSAYGDNVPESTTTGARSETSSVGMPSSSMPPEGDQGFETTDGDVDTSYRLHGLRLLLLEKLIHYLPEIRDVGGVRAIPFMQVSLIVHFSTFHCVIFLSFGDISRFHSLETFSTSTYVLHKLLGLISNYIDL